jgi:alpha-L-rhamnosidase
MESYSLEPHFTFHGFRYVEVKGWAGEPDLAAFTGRVVGSDTRLVGKFSTSHALVNKLYQNIVWGQRGNFLSVPTDCPQRDERLGWMGDAQVFIPTATYNADVGAFFTKYMKDTRDAQGESGGFADISPRLINNNDGSPAWGDAGIIVPYFVYRMYGDLEIIEENFSAMERWIDYILSVNPDLIWTDRVNNNFGDWLNIGAETQKDLLATAYFAYDSLLLSKMAYAINRTMEGDKYKELHAEIAVAFQNAFLNKEDGTLAGDTQTAYLLALAMEMLPEEMMELAAENLAENVRAHDMHLTTGFVGRYFTLPRFWFKNDIPKLF